MSYKKIFLSTYLHYDEAANYLPAWNYVKYEQYAFTVQNPTVFSSISPFITLGGYVGHSLTLIAPAINTKWHLARLWIWLHAAILLALLYLIAKPHFNAKTNLLSVSLLMLNGTFVTYSTRITGEIPGLAGFLLGAWAYQQAKKKIVGFGI
ncbi:MAG: hypothetical protein NZ519_04015 [Bacteroidia bacterium]|nr:hypothetical protein [Bacteroidia bacterium]MDW8302095.1 hypothetical protein [Bacteroidia bacterium]